jgi:hypothetical protein
MRRLLLLAVAAYKRCLSPFMPPACRFTPTCADYAHEAITRHGALAGGWLTLKRLLRCHPLCRGGVDPVPDRRERPVAAAPARRM